jgi:hypothetical protein
MRLRASALAWLLTSLVAVLIPSVVNAAPHRNHDLTIRAVPTHIIAGEGVLIYGHLAGPANAGQTIRLYHRIGYHQAFTLVGRTVTDARGYYEFTRAEGVVDTNRAWFVRGPDSSHSRTVYERVDALVSLNANNSNPNTGQAVTFTGNVFPGHPFERVILQERGASGNWFDLGRGFTGGGSNYAITYRWRTPGAYDVRVLFPGDRRNAAATSDVVSLTVQQKQITGFTINSSAPTIVYGNSATISGVLSTPGAVNAGQAVTLLERSPGQTTWTGVQDAATGTDGSYSFTVDPTANTYYMVRVTTAPSRHSAVLFVGVHDDVSASASTSSGTAGSSVTFTGSVLPGQAGTTVYLQKLGKDGQWHTLTSSATNASSGYSISWTLGDIGTATYRVHVLADRMNLGAVSGQMIIQVSAPASPAELAPAS